MAAAVEERQLPKVTPRRSIRRNKNCCEGCDFCNSELYTAVASCESSRCLRLLHYGADVSVIHEHKHTTYLHLLVNAICTPGQQDRAVIMVYMLSNAGINVNSEDSEGRTALDLAIRKGLVNIMTALLRVGVDPMQKDYTERILQTEHPHQPLLDIMEKFQPGLWAAVAQNNTSLVHMLLNSWCRLNINKNGITLLQFAQGTNKSPELCSLIEDYLVSLEFVHATLAGDEKRMLEFLMDSKPCDPNMMDISHEEEEGGTLQPRSLRDTAIAMGHLHVLHLLPEPDEGETHATSQYTSGHHGNQNNMAESASDNSSEWSEPSTEISPDNDNSGEVDNEASVLETSLWESSIYHPNQYLTVDDSKPVPKPRNKCSRSQSYQVQDYPEENWKQSKPKKRAKYIKSKLCVVM